MRLSYKTLVYFFSGYLFLNVVNSEPLNVYHFEDLWENKYGKIIQSSVLFRHGDRSIVQSYPKNLYPLSIWTDGLGQLLKSGKKREFELGVWLRQRYENIFGEQYKHDQVLVNSSDVDRALMSAQLVLAGMFPPKNEDMWNQFNFSWQPVPIHSTPMELDYCIRQEVPCEKYDLERKLLNESPDLLKYYESHEYDLNYIAKYSGFDISADNVISSLHKASTVYDVLKIEEENQMILPRWSRYVYPEPLEEISAFSHSLLTYTHQMRRLKAGPFLGSVVNDMLKKINENSSSLNLHLYSGHDTSIVNVMSSLDVYNYITPPYSSVLLFELRKYKDSHFITLSYRNSSTKPPYLLNITECGEVCSLNQFFNIVEKLVPSDYEAECKISSITGYFSLFYLQTLCVFSVLIVIIIIFGLTKLHKNQTQTRRYLRYHLLANEELKTHV